MSTPSLLPFQRWIVAALLSDAQSATDLEAYCATESLAHLAFDERKWRRRMELCLVDKAAEAEVLRVVDEIYTVRVAPFEAVPCVGADTPPTRQALHDPPDSEPAGLWRTLEIPLELPALNVRSSSASLAPLG